jgi:hypothetical protein
LGLARRLLWETCRIIEQSDWSCLFFRNTQTTVSGTFHRNSKDIQSQVAAGLISSHQGAASVFLTREEAHKRITEEFDLETLRHEGSKVKSLMMTWTIAEPPTAEDCKSAFPLPMLDLQPYPLVRRLAMKRALTYERYFCPEPGCDVDFTRLDALLRHGRNCHSKDTKSGKATKKTKQERRSVSGSKPHIKGKMRDEDSESEQEDDWDGDEGGDEDDDMEGAESDDD